MLKWMYKHLPPVSLCFLHYNYPTYIPNTSEKRISDILQGISMIAFTLDVRKSQFNGSYVAVTAHFTDHKWRIRDLLVGFEPLTEAQTGLYLREAFITVIERFHSGKKIMSITTDNGANVLSNAEILGNIFADT